MGTYLMTKDKGLQEFDLPMCPVCSRYPLSDMVTVMCFCPDARPETPIQYINRCKSYKPNECLPNEGL